MQHFFVRFIDHQGQNQYTVIETEDYNTLLDNLEQQQHIPLSIIEIPPLLSSLTRFRKITISQEEIIELMENMHLIIKSGLPLHQGLIDLAEDHSNKDLKNMLFHIANDIHTGKSLSVAFEHYEHIIGSIILNFIRIGEETARLQSTLQSSASFLRRIHTLKKKAKSALIYPSFAFLAIIGAMLVWMIYVLPQMTELFEQMNLKLPPLTLFVIAMSDFFSQYIGTMIIAFITLIISYKIAHKKYQKVRYYTDKLMLKIPIISQIISSFNVAFITEYLRLAIISGVPIFSALDTLKKNLGNELFKEALEEATQSVMKGSQLSVAFKKTAMFTPFMLRMMSVGESSGTLETQLEIISKYYYDRVDYYADNIGKVIEPVILTIAGGFMALVITALMGPMYDLIANVQ